MEQFPYRDNLVGNYDEAQVFVSDEGSLAIEKVGKLHAQHTGEKGQTIGSLVSFVAADGTTLMSLWVYKARSTKIANLEAEEAQN